MKEGLLNAAPFVPYLLYPPDDFALVLRFSGGGNYAPGRLMSTPTAISGAVELDAGSQSNAAMNIGGGVAKSP